MNSVESLLSRENEKVKEYCRLNSGKQARRKIGKFTIEGLRLCREALSSGIRPEYAFVSDEGNPIVPLLEEKKIPLFLISGQIEKKIADTSGPQGVYFVCTEPEQAGFETLKTKKLLCLYDVQDPGNLGTIVRCADAFGFEGIVLSQNCCDLFSPKTLRAAMGSAFRLPYYVAADMDAFEAEMRSFGRVSAAAVVDGADLRAGYCILPEIHLLYIGNEGNGLPRDFARRCSFRVTLPMKGGAESLNAAVAAGILMWELGK